MRRSKFNLSHYRLATMEMGRLVPIGLVEVLPGDTFRQSTSALVRMSPLAAPVMHNIDVRIHSFFVPHRIVWDQWEDFITGGPDGNDATLPPRHGPFTVEKGSLANYYGIPTGTSVEAGTISSMPAFGYQAIYNEYYRDQDLVPEATISAGSPPLRIAWEKDYFTGSRPWTQKGDEITVPIGELAPVIPQESDPFAIFAVDGGDPQPLFNQADNNVQRGQAGSGTAGTMQWSDSGLVADLSSATGVSVNEFRRAFALQRYAEARARYGSRYTEYLRYLGITPSDARLQRPEYLGGGRVRVNVSEVLQTAPELQAEQAREYGVGDLYGHGVGAIRTRPYRRFFEEHGYVHTFLSVRPQTIYQDAVPRHWYKENREEFWQKELMQIGQQEIFNGEVFSNAADKRGTFGYADRYAEYKSQPSQVAGDFEDTLNYWHLARKFDSEPVLNQSFIECDPSSRIFNEQTQDPLWVMINHRVAARRLVQKSGASRIL